MPLNANQSPRSEHYGKSLKDVPLNFFLVRFVSVPNAFSQLTHNRDDAERLTAFRSHVSADDFIPTIFKTERSDYLRFNRLLGGAESGR